MINFNVRCVFLTDIFCETRYLPSLSCRIRMTGWALPATVMDPPSLFPSTPTRLVETDGCVSTDGVRSSEFSDSEMGNGSTQSSFFLPLLGHMDLKMRYITGHDHNSSRFHFRNMAIFRNVVNGQPQSNWWDNQSNQIAFGRGNRGFIVFNNDDW